MKTKILLLAAGTLFVGGVALAQAKDVVGPLGSISLGDKPKAEQPAAAKPVSPIPASMSKPGAGLQAAPVQPKPIASAPPAKPVAATAAAVKPKPTPSVAAAPPSARPAPPAKPVAAPPAKPVAAPSKPAAAVADAPASKAIATAAALSAPPPQPVPTVPAHVAPGPAAIGMPSPPKPRRVEPLPLQEREIAYQNREAELIREIRLLSLEARAAELRKKIIGDSQPADDSVNLPPPVLPMASVLDLPEEPPVRLISVWGTPGALTADVLSNGIRTSVKAGDRLPDGWQVVEVGRNSVLIQRGKKKTLVKMGA